MQYTISDLVRQRHAQRRYQDNHDHSTQIIVIDFNIFTDGQGRQIDLYHNTKLFVWNSSDGIHYIYSITAIIE